MKGYVRIATEEDTDKIYALRLTEYQRNTKDMEWIRPEILKWDDYDRNGIVLAVWDDTGKPLSTMAGIVVYEKQEAENVLEVSLPENVLFPVLILRRGATDTNYTSIGLNSLLRYYFFKNINQSDVKTVLGSIYINAPRSKTMLNMGYSFINLGLIHESGFNNKTESELVILTNTFFESATFKLYDLTMNNVGKFPYIGVEISY